jgi:hypothetical protein
LKQQVDDRLRQTLGRQAAQQIPIDVVDDPDATDDDPTAQVVVVEPEAMAALLEELERGRARRRGRAGVTGGTGGADVGRRRRTKKDDE